MKFSDINYPPFTHVMYEIRENYVSLSPTIQSLSGVGIHFKWHLVVVCPRVLASSARVEKAAEVIHDDNMLSIVNLCVVIRN